LQLLRRCLAACRKTLCRRLPLTLQINLIEDVNEFNEPSDALYKLEKKFGDLFESLLSDQYSEFMIYLFS